MVRGVAKSQTRLKRLSSSSLGNGEGNGTPLQYSCLENPMDGGAWRAAAHGVAKSQTQLHFHFSLSCIGEGNGNSLQCSCLENPRDEGAWWAAVYGVAQSQTRLKWLSSSSSSSLGKHVELWCRNFSLCNWNRVKAEKTYMELKAVFFSVQKRCRTSTWEVLKSKWGPTEKATHDFLSCNI